MAIDSCIPPKETVDIAPDGSFEFDASVNYPTVVFLNIDKQMNGIYLIPGDTVNFATSPIIEESGYNSKMDGLSFLAPYSDSEIATVLIGDMDKRYKLDNLYNYRVQTTDTVQAPIYEVNRRLFSGLDAIMTELPDVLSTS